MLRNQIKSEFFKLIYHKGLLLTLVFSILFVLTMLLALNPSASIINEDFIVTQFLQSIYLVQTIFAVFSAVFWGREFLKSTLRTSLLANPNRLKFFCMKSVITLFSIICCFCIAIGIGIGLVSFYFKFQLNLEFIRQLLLKIIPPMLATIQISMITLCLTILMESMVSSLTIVLSMLLGLGQLLLQYSSRMNILPVLATMNSFSINEISIYPSVTEGIFIQTVWMIVFIGLSYYHLHRKSVK
ncbi:hypothetical protein [Granulicatella sp.]